MSDSATAAVPPPLAGERLGAAVQALAEQVSEPEVRAQLHALKGILRNLDTPAADQARRAELERAVRTALERADEAGAIAAARELARRDRSAVQALDWSASSGG